MAQNWSEAEVRAIVGDYFSMLQLELGGETPNKAQHRRALREKLNERSEGAVEFKHQNISAVLIEMGIPYIDGYKPLFNYQRTVLPEVVSRYLEDNPSLQRVFEKDTKAEVQIPTVDDFLSAMEEPPLAEARRPIAAADGPSFPNPGGVNYLEVEARNRSLGEAGEKFVINFEQARLIHAGRESLAERIEQVSVTVGPSAGFDVRSFEEDGSDRLIEVKTTKYGKDTPFFITPHELSISRQKSPCYVLYRLFKFRQSPRLFALRGCIEECCILEPSAYKARVS